MAVSALPLTLLPLSKLDIGGCFYLPYQAAYISRRRRFNHAYYQSEYPDARSSGLHPIVHYMLYGAERGYNPSPRFDTTAYLAEYPGLNPARVNPFYHYLKHRGQEETVNRAASRPPRGFWGRLIRPAKSTLLQAMMDRGLFLPQSAGAGDGTSSAVGSPGASKLIVVSHDASRTGAPLIVLKLLEQLTVDHSFETIVFLDKAKRGTPTGELIDQFHELGHVIINDPAFSLFGGRHRSYEWILDRIARPTPTVAIVNSANSMHYLPQLRRRGIPTLVLVHEYLNFWPRETVNKLYRDADQIVFPSQFVRASADAYCPVPPNLGRVIPQGLLNDHLLKLDRAETRKDIRRSLGITGDAFVVLGCGTLDLRKGVDRFISVAIEASTMRAQSEPKLYFVWVGGAGPHTPEHFERYCRDDIRHAGLEEFIRFVGPQVNPGEYFACADIFFLSSRNDPLPCVVHEAMAVGLPVIAFENAGGAPEMIRDGGGIVVPYHDIGETARWIVALSDSPEDVRSRGEVARKVVNDRYSFSRYTNAIVHTIRDDLGVDFPHPAGSDDASTTARKPKVFFATPDFGVSGVNTLAQSLVRELNDRGIDARFLITTSESPKAEERFFGSQPYTYLSTEPLKGIEYWRALLRFLKRHAPCILVPNYDYVTSAISPSLPSNVGIIGIAHADDIEHYEHVYRLGRYWNAIVCVSCYIRDRVTEMNPAFGSLTHYIPSGIDAVPIELPFRERSPDDPIQIVYTGRLVQRQKRVLDFVPLVRELERRNVPFKFTAIGEGEELHRLRRELRGNAASGQVELPGRLAHPDILDRLSSSDVFLLTSAWEGTPVSLMEAMSRGCVPVVAECRSGVPDLVHDGENGYIVPVGDTLAMADRIQTLQEDQELFAAFREKAHRRILGGGFTAEKMGENYANLIQSIFAELVKGEYERPQSIHYLPHVGAVALPPIMQSLSDQRVPNTEYWDLDALERE